MTRGESLNSYIKANIFCFNMQHRVFNVSSIQLVLKFENLPENP